MRTNNVVCLANIWRKGSAAAGFCVFFVPVALLGCLFTINDDNEGRSFSLKRPPTRVFFLCVALMKEERRYCFYFAQSKLYIQPCNQRIDWKCTLDRDILGVQSTIQCC
jgi:hypothetical protein